VIHRSACLNYSTPSPNLNCILHHLHRGWNEGCYTVLILDRRENVIKQIRLQTHLMFRASPATGRPYKVLHTEFLIYLSDYCLLYIICHHYNNRLGPQAFKFPNSLALVSKFFKCCNSNKRPIKERICNRFNRDFQIQLSKNTCLPISQ
jgi:hypothetical protein